MEEIEVLDMHSSDEGVSNKTQPTCDTPSRKRVLSQEDTVGEPKKQKTDFVVEKGGVVDNDTVFAMFQSLSNQMNDLYGDLSKRISNIEANLENKLTQKLKTSIDAGFGEVREEVNKQISEVRKEVDTQVNNIKSVKSSVQKLEKSYAEIVKNHGNGNGNGGENVDRAKNIVIRNLPVSENEHVVNKVNGMLRDGLKIRDVTVATAVRKGSGRENRPGVVIATCKSVDDKKKIMSNKRALKDTRHYEKVYLDHDLSKGDRNLAASLKSIVDVVGRGKLRINGSRVRKASDNRQSEHSDNSADQTRSHTDQSARRDTQPGRYVNNRGHGRGRGGSGRRGR